MELGFWVFGCFGCSVAVEPGGWFWGGFGGVLVLEAGRLGGVPIVL